MPSADGATTGSNDTGAGAGGFEPQVGSGDVVSVGGRRRALRLGYPVPTTSDGSPSRAEEGVATVQAVHAEEEVDAEGGVRRRPTDPNPQPRRDSGEHDANPRPPSPGMLQALQLLGAQHPTVFAEAAEASYEDYLRGAQHGGGGPVYGIPVVCVAPQAQLPAAAQNQSTSLGFPVLFRGAPTMSNPTSAPPATSATGFGGATYSDALTMPGQTVLLDETQAMWSLARSCRIFAVADLFIVAILVFSRYWMAALAPFPIIGFVGARRYVARLVSIYLAYFPAVLAARAYFAYSNVDSDVSKSALIGLVLLSAAGGLAELYIAFIVSRLRRALSSASPEMLELLRSGWCPLGASSFL